MSLRTSINKVLWCVSIFFQTCESNYSHEMNPSFELITGIFNDPIEMIHKPFVNHWTVRIDFVQE